MKHCEEEEQVYLRVNGPRRQHGNQMNKEHVLEPGEGTRGVPWIHLVSPFSRTKAENRQQQQRPDSLAGAANNEQLRWNLSDLRRGEGREFWEFGQSF